jgi:hypothetical protein
MIPAQVRLHHMQRQPDYLENTPMPRSGPIELIELIAFGSYLHSGQEVCALAEVAMGGLHALWEEEVRGYGVLPTVVT